MSELYFVEPTADAFITSLTSLCANKTARTVLVGENCLARDILSSVDKTELPIEYYSSLEFLGIDEPLVLVFTATSGAELSICLAGCIDRQDMVVLAPITDWHFSKKPLFLVSIPKSGTHLLYEMAQALGYHAGVEIPEFPVGQTWYCIEYTNSHTIARDFFVDTVKRSPFGNRHHSFVHSPTLFMYRHPLDILLSEAHYYHQDGKTLFAGWFDELDFNERVSSLLSDNGLIGSLRERIGGYLPWLDFPNVISLSFEELIGAAGGGNDEDQLNLIWSIQLKLQIPGNSQDIASHLFNPDSPTFRSGQIGAFKRDLSAKDINYFINNNEDILKKLGYTTDGTVCLPVNREARRKQRIKYSQVEYENMPLNIESNYLGCNLVRYSKKFYAIPIAAGQVSLESLRDDVLAAIPSAPSLSEIKSLLLMGGDEIALRRQSLNQLARAIRESDPTLAANQYWSVLGNLTIVDEYMVYTYAGRVWATEMGNEAIDFEDTAAVEDRLTDGRLIKADTMDGIKAAIERQRDRKNYQAGLEKIEITFEGHLSALSDRLEHELQNAIRHSDARLDDIEQRLGLGLERLTQRLSEIAPIGDEACLLEEGYLGYNILANAGTVWAAEMGAGAIDFEDAAVVEDWLSDGRLLKATTMDGVKAAIERQRDRRNYEAGLEKIEITFEGHLSALSDRLERELQNAIRHRDARLDDIEQRLGLGLERLTQRLSEIAPLGDETCLLEEGYLGYNIQANAGTVWAAETGAGAIDFEDAAAVEEWLSDGRLLQASTVDGAKAAVERMCDRRNFNADLMKINTRMVRYASALTKRLESSLQDMAKRSELRMGKIAQTLGHNQEMQAQLIEHRLVMLEHPWLRLVEKLRKKLK